MMDMLILIIVYSETRCVRTRLSTSTLSCCCVRTVTRVSIQISLHKRMIDDEKGKEKKEERRKEGERH